MQQQLFFYYDEIFCKENFIALIDKSSARNEVNKKGNILIIKSSLSGNILEIELALVPCPHFFLAHEIFILVHSISLVSFHMVCGKTSRT